MSPAALRVLVAEDEEHLGAILETFLGARGHAVHRVRDGRAAVEALGRGGWDVALLDVMMPEMDGLEVLRTLAGDARAPQAVVMTGNATVDVALSALQLGAYDYITKPYRMAEMDALVRRAAEKGALRREVALLRRRLADVDPPPDFVTRHPALLAALAEGAAARGAAAVMAVGERGTGRRTLLRWLHAHDDPGSLPLLEMACTGDPTRDEAALFGAPPATAPAVLGALEAAEGGALLLRDVERLAPATAARLSAALAARAGEGGDGVPAAPRTRLLLHAGARPSLPLPVTETVVLPPLRERPVDIRPLAEHLLRAAPYRAADGAPLALDAGAAAWLEAQPWPGNAAELRLVLELAALRAGGSGVVREAHVRAASGGTAGDQDRNRE